MSWVLFNAWLILVFPACPRCGLNAFLVIEERWRPFSGQYLFSRLRRRPYLPNATCSRCGLDLKRHGLFDPRARKAA